MGTGTGSIDLSTLNGLHDNLTQHFWFNSDAGATYGTGVHITLSSQAEFIANPTGQNILMNTDGISIRNGTIPLMVLDNDSLDFNVVTDLAQGTYSNVATFGATGFRMGAIADGETRLVANGAGVDLIRREGTSDTTLAHFGYDYGNTSDESSDQEKNPYYTLGYRSPNYDVGNWSVAEGDWTVASGFASHAEGMRTVASETASHAEGSEALASGIYSHAEGLRTVASGFASHAEGSKSTASGSLSFAHGMGVEANFDYECVVGRFNIARLAPYADIIYICTEDDYDKATLTFPNTYGNYGESGDFLVTYNGKLPASPQAITWSNSTITITARLLSPDGSTKHFEEGDEIGILINKKLPLFLVGNGDGGYRSNAFAVDRKGDARTQGDIYVNCNADSSGGKKIGENKLLWSGAWFMNGNQSAKLSEKVSEQLTGIVLVWSYYINGAAQDYGWHTFFVPKGMVKLKNGVGYDIPLRRDKNVMFGTKYVYVYDDRINGYANNEATGTASNVPYQNNKWVLRYVFGC